MKVAQLCPTLCKPMDFSPSNSPGQNTGVGSLSLLQGILPTQGSNSGFLPCRRVLHQLNLTSNCLGQWLGQVINIQIDEGARAP